MTNEVKRFLIRYRDPDTQEIKEFERECKDTPAGPGHAAVSAFDWAEDAAYAAADKGWYEITEIKR